MLCFVLPNGLCGDIERIISKFLWGGDVTMRGLHCANWNKLHRVKCDGGLGFKDFRSFDLALVGKTWWRIYSHPETLIKKIFRGVYFSHGSLWEAKKGPRPSYAWSSILSTSWIFQRGARWRI